MAPDALVRCNPDGALAVHRDVVDGVAFELDLFPLAQVEMGEAVFVAGPHVAGTIDGKGLRVQVHDAVFFGEEAPAVLVVNAFLGNQAGNACAFDGHKQFLAVFGPHQGVDFLAGEHLALLFELSVAVQEETVVGAYPEACALVHQGGNAPAAQFFVVVFPGLAVKAEEALGSAYPELFGAVIVDDGRDGVVYHQVPGHLDFYHVGFLFGGLDVVELFYLARVFVNAALRTDINFYGVLDLGVALQGDGVVIYPLFAVVAENALGGSGPEFAFGEKAVLAAGRHLGKEGSGLGIGGVGHAPFVGQGAKGKSCRVVEHGGGVVGHGSAYFTHA